MSFEITGSKSLYAIRDLITPIANIGFFIKLDDSNVHYSDDELACIIKADNYNKMKQKVAEFSTRKKEDLERFKQQTVLAREAELETAQRNADSNRPGSPPGGLFLDKSDYNAVARHNQRVEEYNNRVDLYRRLIDKRDQAKERYEDSLARLQDKKEEIEQQIREKEEELKPSLDRDMVAFLGKLQQLVYDCFHNKGLVFESFVLLFMAKKAYIFVYDRIDSAGDRNTVNGIFHQMNDELNALLEKHSVVLKQGFTEIVGYLYGCFRENEVIANSMQEQMEQLPYDACRANEDSAHSLVSLVVDTNFQYVDIIDPGELAHIEVRVQERCEQFKDSVAQIDRLVSHLAVIFDSIAEVFEASKEKLQMIYKNKEAHLGETFEYSRFVLGVFDEEIQDEYLKQQKSLLEEMQLEIETSLGTNLKKLIDTILETEMLSLSASQKIDANAAFAFLEYRQQLQEKRQELVGGLSTLDRHLQEISQQPKQRSKEFTDHMQKLLKISVLPIGNLFVLFPLHQLIAKFSSAFGSEHPVYMSLREAAGSKLQVFIITHAVITVLIGCSTFAVKNDQKPFVLGMAGAYAISTGVIFFEKKQIRACLKDSNAV